MKQKTEKRYIVIEFDGTTTRAFTFRARLATTLRAWYSGLKGFKSSEARLHPDDVYDQNEGIRIALERIGFDVPDNPFIPVLKALRIVSDVFGNE